MRLILLNERLGRYCRQFTLLLSQLGDGLKFAADNRNDPGVCVKTSLGDNHIGQFNR
jgi:hypothetical protein